MKRGILALVILGAGLAVAYGYTATRRERLFRQHVVRGDYALVRGDAFGARAAFTDAIGAKPESMLGYLKRGEAHRRRGELDEASRDLQTAAALDPASTRVLELLGDVEAARELPGQAAIHYAAYTALDDGSPRVLYKLGLALHMAGRAADAAAPLTRAVGLDGRFAEAHYLLGVCLRDQDRLREAQRALERAVALKPSLIAAREQLADLYEATGRRTDRIEQLQALVARDGGPGRHIALALASADAGNTSRAIRILGKAAELFPDHAETYVALGRIWLDRSADGADRIALGKAIEALQHAVSMEPSSAALALLGQARLAAAEAPLAEVNLRQATERLPADEGTFLRLADAAERTGHAHAARRALLDYHSLLRDGDSRRLDAAQRIADLSMRLADWKAAVRWYRSAAAGPRPATPLLLQLAEAHLRAGDAPAARGTLARVLERDPADLHARALEQRLLRQP